MINPGAVSGPGRQAKRSDLPPKPPGQVARKMPNAEYGEQKQFQAEQAGAPMAQAANPMAGIVPLTAPTNRPNEPVTAGVDAGPGPGSEILGLKTPVDTQLQDLSVLAKYMPMFESFADSPESSGTTKAFIKYLRSQAE
jgi:hypothetical protein